MFENVMKFIFGTVEDDVKTILELEKSIQSNKDEALDLGKEFIPIINKLNRDSRLMNNFCKSKTNQTEKVDNLTTLGKIDGKLEKAKSEYHQLLGELRKSNQDSEDKIEKLFKKEKVKTFYEAYNQKKTNVENLIKGFSTGLLDYDKLEKCHNFISREKVGEDFIYTYKEDELIKGEPTEAQKHAGNYKKEKKSLRGLVISIENKKGSTRSGKSEDGKDWSVTMNNDYGYFNRTLGKDGDHIDVFLSDKPEDGNIYVIDQLNEKGNFDEHKVMMGFKSSEDALKNYKSNYEKDFKVKYSGITEVSDEKLKKWLGVDNGGKSKKSKPFSELKKALDSDIEKGGGYSEDQLKEMISEHERLIKVLESVPNKTPRIKSELKIQKEELEGYKEDLEAFTKSIVTIDDNFNVFDEFEPDLYKSEDDYIYDPEYIEKAIGGKDISKLTKKVIMVTRGGKTFKQTVYVSTEDDKKEVETPIGGELTPEIKGLSVTQYSDKAIFIGGDTYASLDLMRDIKSSIGVGTFNKKLGGWFFPMKYKEEVLGIIYSDVKNKGEDEKAEAIKNQKNSLDKGTDINIGEIKGKVEKEVSDSDGIKYNIKTEDGTELNGVDEKVIETKAETDDKKIAEIQNKASAESRVKVEKQIYGIKPVANIQNYSLKEYLGMHGLTDDDIQKVLDVFKNKGTKKEAQKRASTGGVKKEYTNKNQIEGLTKRQLIGKLVYAHYQAVKKAIEAGENLKPEVLDLYEELKASYSKKRQAMSEETKRKIAEALRKNKVPEVEAEKTTSEIPEKEIEEVKSSFKAVDNEEVRKYQAELAALIVERDETQKKFYDLFEQSRSISEYKEKSAVQDEARALNPKIDKLKREVRLRQNIVQALSSGGKLVTVTDKVGVKHENVPNFTNIDTSEIMYNIDNILTTEKPKYIPDIDEADFADGSYIFDTIRVSEDQYLLATNKYREKSRLKEGYSIKEGDYDTEGGGFIQLTLDQLVLTQDYYTTKKKAEYKEKAAERNRRQEESWDKKEDSAKERWLTQRGMYRGLPAKVKKQVTEPQWEAMTWQEREKHYKPIKKYGAEKLKSNFDERHMAASFHAMYERFVNPEAQAKLKDGTKLKRGDSSTHGIRYADPEAMKSWKDFREMLDWKINDINIQREEIGEIRSKALETSYGMINTNDTLKKEFGILVKRQNGDKINPIEVDQLKGAWENVQQTFGKLKDNANRDNLKLSHAGKTHMFASKAIGIYIPSMKTIGVTAKLGEDQLGFTMGHEVAHWIDNTIGKSKGKRFMSDNYESTAGKMAIAFRANMNESSSSNYVNATHECFARAMEQHHAIQTQGKNAVREGKDEYTTSSRYVSMEVYEKQIKPLAEQFLKENKELLKSIGVELFSEENEDTLEKARTGKYADIPENRRLHRVGQPYGSKAQEEAPKGPKTAKTDDSKQEPKGSIDEQAKTASGSALETAAKEASDPEVRAAAHKEIDRRSKEEAVQEEETTDGGEKKKGEPIKKEEGGDEFDKQIAETESAIQERRKALSDVDDLDEIIKESDKIQKLVDKRKQLIEDQKSLRKVDFDEYRLGFKDLSGEEIEKIKERNKFYKEESKKSSNYLTKHPDKLRAINSYVGDGFENTREYLSNPKEYKDEGKFSKFNMKTLSDDLSKFIKSNSISENLSLNRRISLQNSGGFFEKLDIGDIYEDKSFSSSSIKELGHFGDFNIEILAKKGSSVANIDNSSEYEYLIDKGSKFRVIDKNEGGIIVELL